MQNKSSQTVTHNQHYVPKFLIKKFKNDNSPLNIAYKDGSTLNHTNRKITKVHTSKDTYELINVNTHTIENLNSTEHALRDLESIWAKTLTDVLSLNDLKNISLDQIYDLITFIINMNARNPNANHGKVLPLGSVGLDKAKDISIISTLLDKIEHSESLSKSEKHKKKDLILNSGLISDHTRYLHYFKHYHSKVNIFKNKNSSLEFILSDNPVIYRELKNILFWSMPISPKIIINIIVNTEELDEYDPEVNIKTICEDDIKRHIVNQLAHTNSHEFVYKNPNQFELLKEICEDFNL